MNDRRGKKQSRRGLEGYENEKMVSEKGVALTVVDLFVDELVKLALATESRDMRMKKEVMSETK